MTHDKSHLREQQTRGNEAKSLVESPAFRNTMADIRAEIYDGWKNSQANEEEQRRNAYLMHRLLDRFESHLRTTAATGEHAKHLLADLDET